MGVGLTWLAPTLPAGIRSPDKATAGSASVASAEDQRSSWPEKPERFTGSRSQMSRGLKIPGQGRR